MNNSAATDNPSNLSSNAPAAVSSASRPSPDACVSQRDLLFQRAMTLTKNRADAEDLVQDTMVRALEYRETIRPEATGGWMYRVMRNLFIDKHCRRRRHGLLADDQIERLTAPPPYKPTEWEYLTHQDVWQALDGLRPPFKEVMDLRLNKNRSYADISKDLSIPKSTVGTRLLKARRYVRDLLIEGPMPSQAPSETYTNATS